MSTPDRLTFIGAGHLGQAIISGLYSSEARWKDACPVSITARRAEHKDQLRDRYPRALVTTDNRHPAIWGGEGHDDAGAAAPSQAHVVFICTRPNEVPGVCREIADALGALPAARGVRPPTVVTLCPGISVAQLQSWLPAGTPVVRAMPNLPVTCGEGAAALFAGAGAAERLPLVAAVLGGVCPTVRVLPEEALLDVAASISGSAPAYFYYLIEALVAAAEAHGMCPETARSLVVQSCLGAGMLSRATDRPVQVLREEVCVPGGSTEKAIAYLKSSCLPEIVHGAVDKSLHANREMRYVEGKPT